jgi:hypothetical protein
VKTGSPFNLCLYLGTREDLCEVSPDHPCAWQLIYKRLKGIGQLDRLKEIKKRQKLAQ